MTRERPDYGVPFSVSKEQEKLADERVEFILFRMTRQDLTVRTMLRSAYFQGLQDAAQVLMPKIEAAASTEATP